MDQQNTQGIQEAQPTPPVTTARPNSPVSPSKKKVWIPLIIIVAILVLLAGIGVAAVSVLRSNADVSAKNYTIEVTNFLNKYASTIDNSTTASDAISSTKSLAQPKLSDSPMAESLSGNYRKAQNDQKQVAAIVTQTQGVLNQYATVQKFIDDYNAISQKVENVTSNAPTSPTGASSYLTQLTGLNGQAQQITKDFNAPQSLVAAKSSLLTALEGKQTALSSMQSAASSRNQGAYTKATDEFSTAADDEQTALDVINQFEFSADSSTISQHVSDLINKL